MRILISSIGTGIYHPDTGRYEYRSCLYGRSQDRSSTVPTPYIIFALYQFYKIDKIVLLGTAGSDWAAFYQYATDPSSNQWFNTAATDTDYLAELRRLMEEPDHSRFRPEETEKKLAALKHSLYDRCLDICVLNYGRSTPEMQENLFRIQKLSERFQDGDEIIFDITHSFRSLPFYEMIALNYCRDVLGRNVTITDVSYGMLEAARENDGVAPIVSIKPLLSMLDCMKAADEYRRFGTVHGLLELIEQNSDTLFHFSKSERKALQGFNETIMAGIPEDFDRMLEKCHAAIQDTAQNSPALRLLIDTVLCDIDRTFYELRSDRFLLSCALADRHLRSHHEQTAALILSEAMLDYLSGLCGYPSFRDDNGHNEAFRLAINNAYLPRSKIGAMFLDAYQKLRRIRNVLAHPTNAETIRSCVKSLPELISAVKERYCTLKNDSSNEDQLKQSILSALPAAEKQILRKYSS